MPLIYKSQCDMQHDFMKVGRAGEGLSTEQKMLLAKRLIDEEVNKELLPAVDTLIPLMNAAEDTNALGDSITDAQAHELLDAMAEVADGIVDSVYVIYQLCNFIGLPFDAMFAEVHRSNMSKFLSADGNGMEVLKDEGGKILKGPRFSKPELKQLVAAAIFRQSESPAEPERQDLTQLH